jgi:carboxymethylenebutenolidase
MIAVRRTVCYPACVRIGQVALRDYLAEEVGEDWADGLITRREAVRRLALLGLSTSAAAALLAACAPASQPSSPSVTTGPSAGAATASPVSTASLAGEAIRFAGPRGELQAFFASASGSARGAMLVIHENRGLTDHIRFVASRLAADGYAALAVDLLSEEGGTAALADPAGAPAALGAASTDRLVGDMKAGLGELARRVPGAKLGAIGFCFGGGMVWQLLDSGEPRLAAAIPFYGPAPEQPDFAGNGAAVLAVYAELDSRVNASRERAEAALRTANLPHEIKVYPGVDHAFFNDTGGRYNATQAAAAYRDVLTWLGRYLGA